MRIVLSAHHNTTKRYGYDLGNARIELVHKLCGVMVQLDVLGRKAVGGVGCHGFREAAWCTEVRRIVDIDLAYHCQ